MGNEGNQERHFGRKTMWKEIRSHNGSDFIINNEEQHEKH